MPIASRSSWLAILRIGIGCGPDHSAIISGKGGAQVPATIIAYTGDGILSPFEADLPSGTRVTIVRRGGQGKVARVRVEEGRYKGREADVAGESLQADR
jgi:hypothetical protein